MVFIFVFQAPTGVSSLPYQRGVRVGKVFISLVEWL